jgi:demethylmenaquinone methyltransferase/2-methoxy-6-polyprenyl-1,4-benzoquinol methylase
MPKLPMKEYISSRDKKQVYVNQMFARIAPCYDLVTRLLSFGADKRWKRRLVQLAEVEPCHHVLDLACGTGDITFQLARRIVSGEVVGVDITPGMLKIAEKKRQVLGTSKIRFELDDIICLDYPDNQFDRVTVGYGVRNVPDISRLLNEVFRLLKTGGKFLSLDFGKPVNPTYRAIYLKYLTLVGSTMGLLLHGDPDVYRYIPESLKLYPGQVELERMMISAGFVETGHTNFLGGAIAINFGNKPSQAKHP